MLTRKQIGKNVVRARRRRWLSQEQVCERAGVTQPVLSYIEDGRRDTRLSTLLLIADGIGCSPAEFFEGGKHDN